MSAHTPGPWVTDGHIYGGERVFTYPDNTGYQVCAVACHSKEGEANARLIAAAPELLEALSMAYELCLQLPTGEVRLRNQRTLCLARDAIAKATGQEPEQVQDDHESYALQSRSAA